MPKAGDLLSPSALGTAIVEGQRLAGQQMVAVMNAIGLDYATFGNHEFDLSETELLKRLGESKFQWLSSNVSDVQGQAFPNVTLSYDTQTRCLTANSKLQAITAALPEDPKTARVVKYWQDRGFQGFRTGGFEPEAVITTLVEALDGTEVNVRNQPTNLAQLIAQAMLRVAATQSPGVLEPVNLAIFNSGSIRIDDQLHPGPITQYDVIRILPFGGKVLVVKLPGALLQKVLTQGQANRGTGGFLQTANVTQSANGQWLIQGQPLQIDRDYVVAINDFLISGREIGLNYLTLKAPGVTLLADKGDIRFALIKELQRSGK